MNFFNAHALCIGTVIPPIRWIDRAHVFANQALLLVGPTADDGLHQMLQGPFVRHKIRSQPIEQFWMRWRRTLQTKV